MVSPKQLCWRYYSLPPSHWNDYIMTANMIALSFAMHCYQHGKNRKYEVLAWITHTSYEYNGLSTLNMLKYFSYYKRYIHILNHIMDLPCPKWKKLTLKQQYMSMMLSVLHSQYHACWCRHQEKFWAFTGPRTDFGLILLVSNMVKHISFTGPTHFLSANVRGTVSFAVSGWCSGNFKSQGISRQGNI